MRHVDFPNIDFFILTAKSKQTGSLRSGSFKAPSLYLPQKVFCPQNTYELILEVFNPEKSSVPKNFSILKIRNMFRVNFLRVRKFIRLKLVEKYYRLN